MNVEENTFKKYVEPIYGHLMTRTMIFQQPIDVQLEFKQKVVEALADVTDDILKKLLWDSNWRFSLVGSWLIFIKNKTEFIDDICKFLLQGKAGTIGYCFTLAKFGTLQCSEYLTSYLKKELFFDKSPIERFQDTAIYSLVYIDNKNKTSFSKQFLEPSGLWTQFIEYEFLKNKRLKDSSRWGSFDENYQNFVCMLDFMNTITAKP